MRSIIKMLRILIYWIWEMLTFTAPFVSVDAAFKGDWSLCALLLITAIFMRIELDKIKAWAKKF